MLMVTEKNEILVHNDGDPFPFAMITRDNGVEKTVFADTRTDLFSFFMPGYDALNDDEAQEQLQSFAEITSSQLQTSAVASVEGFDPNKYSEAQVNAIFGERGLPTVLKKWSLDEPFPLYLVATLHAPYSNTSIPAGGNVVLLNPENETTLLESMEKAGLIRLVINEEALMNYSDQPDTFKNDEAWADPRLLEVWKTDD
ncbi:hypothetical protein ACTXJX_11870 [Glutamicibacter ardleyensis]|uniref:hypothetical protein n=1 Tax=Glutamicibacter ardleyensis TaxID=225894 RepID=UPI003FD500FB